MGDLSERFLALESRQKLGLIAAVPLFVLVLYFLLLLGPRLSHTAELSRRVEEMAVDRARKAAATAGMEERVREVALLDRDLKLAMTQLPDKKEIPDLLSSISTLARDSGLDILIFRQKPETYQEFYARVPVEMEVRGTYHQVAGFLDRVGRLDRIVNVSELVVNDPMIEGNDLILRANSRVTTFRFLGEEERKRLAEEGKMEEAKK
ncbi:MAG: type 4a pilus biogenesis protein PilO [Deltaproteobacteria bacterium]